MISSNTGQNRKPGTFVAGDKRINRKGRPKAFDYIREIAQKIGSEIEPYFIDKDGGKHLNKKTNAEIVLRRLMKDDGAKFIEVAYGKTTENLNVSGGIDSKLIIEVIEVKQK